MTNKVQNISIYINMGMKSTCILLQITQLRYNEIFKLLYLYLVLCVMRLYIL